MAFSIIDVGFERENLFESSLFLSQSYFFYFRKQCMLLLDIYGLFLSPVLSFYEKSSLFLGIKERNTVLETHESEEMTGMSFLGELFFYACFSYSW